MKWLDFFCLLSDDGSQLSLTNLALIALTIKMLLSPTLDWPSTITMMTVFANYAHRRHIGAKEEMAPAAQDIRNQTAAISDLEKKLQPIIDKVKGVL